MKLYRLSHSEDGTNTLEALRELDESEAAEYMRCCQHLHDFERARDMLAFVTDSLEAFRVGIEERRTLLAAEPARIFDQDPRPRRKLQRLAVDYLNALRLYLDHKRTNLSRKYGADSAALAAFDAARRAIHDREPVYRFTYELRNFVQHCGMPLQMLRGRQRIVPNESGETLASEVFIGFSKEELLRSYDEWRHGRAFIEQQTAEFEALPVFERTTELLWEIEQASVAAFLPQLWRDAQYVVKLLEQGTNDTGMGIPAEFVRRDPGETQATISFKAPPYSILVWLKLVRLLDRAPGISFDYDALARVEPPRLT